MTFASRLDRWVLATTLLSTLMFFLASGKGALAPVAMGLIALGYLASARKPSGSEAASGRGFVLLLNALTLGVLGYAVLRVSGDRELLVESVGDLLAWALVIRVYDPRANRRRGLLLLMSVFGALAAVLTSNALIIGVLMLAYTPVATWTIMLHQFAKGHEQVYASTARAPALAVSREAIRRLRSLAIRLAPVAVVISFVVYILMPRGIGADMLGEWDAKADGAATGFTDRVMLQRSGQLASSDEPVMDVVVTDSRGANLGSSDRAVLLRGAVLERYDSEAHAWVRADSWSRVQTRGSALTDTEVSRVRDDTPLTTYRVTMRNKDTEYLFAPYRPVSASLDRDTTLEIGVSDLVLRAERREGRMTYSVLVAPEWVPHRAGDAVLPSIEIPERVVARAREILADAEVERDPGAEITENDARAARVLESYFQRNGVYDTAMTASPVGVDPIEHFVFERMNGHCEQFASAMAGMLRGLGISARVVTGYRAHEFNDIAGHYTVRQRDAHAWVEVRTGEGIWQTFDPSPAQADALGIAGDGGIFRRARQAYEAIEHLWVVYVVSFDEQMKRAFFERFGVDLREVGRNARRADTRMWRPGEIGPRLLRAAGAGLIAFAATAGVLYGAAAALRLLGSRFRLPTLGKAFARRRAKKTRATIAMERRFAKAMDALARAGLERPASRGALAHAGVVGDVNPTLGETVRSLTAMHYAARFGGRAMNEAEIGRADELVRQVEEAARAHWREARRNGRSGGRSR